MLAAEGGVAAAPTFIRDRIAAFPTRRIRGKPKCGKTLLPPNQLIADIRSPASVRTSKAYGRAISV